MAPKVLIATGATGGHLFPALACAEEFRQEGWEVSFVGTGRTWERENLELLGEYEVLEVRPLKSGGPKERVRSLLSLPLALGKALGILRRKRPDLVLGFGSYVSGPMIIASFLLKIPRAIHEQNVRMGLANRLSLPFAERVFVSFEETLRGVGTTKGRLTGNPIRKSVLREAAEVRREGAPFTLFVLGGSQGSAFLNRTVVEALKGLKAMGVRLIHQTGPRDHPWVVEAYREAGLEAKVFPFDLHIGRHYGIAHLVLCRSGALTLAELSAIGRASFLVPYPYGDGHQYDNAEVFSRRGAALLFPQEKFSHDVFLEALREVMERRDKREEMEERARGLGRPEAARMVVEGCKELVDVQG